MKTLAKLIACCFIVSFVACTNQAPKDVEMVEKNKEAVKKVFAAFETGSTEGLENYVAENCVEHTPPPGMEVQGLQGLKDMVKMHHDGFPDTKIEVVSMTGEGDRVIAHFRMTGTNTGSMMGMPATNKKMDVMGVDIIRFENGKGVEHWGYWEEGKMMAQLGLAPEPGQTPPATATEEKK